ncbi:hypothetical protein [Pseudomonas sp. Q1]|uniref:hypothetical protein n=1 Tax=Pseudomonas sp. Q1 TaxID=2202823 RepID=UPI001374EE73|nr:hypothetical protein [Pseudomonas sp. Q1]NCE85282.1 hypothetical protein [Pseudomonas sp. Q1]
MPKFKRLKALLDQSAWLLILPSLLTLFLIDTAMLQTLIQWLVFAPVLAGLAIIVSRVVFPQIHLSTLVEQTGQGNTAAGLLAAALVLFVAVVIMALVMWAKA